MNLNNNTQPGNNRRSFPKWLAIVIGAAVVDVGAYSGLYVQKLLNMSHCRGMPKHFGICLLNLL